MIQFDAIKIGYRQSKDGFVILLAIHPQDMPTVLANSDIGSQWQFTGIPLDDDGNAEQQKAQSPELVIEPPARVRRPVSDNNLPTAEDVRGILRRPVAPDKRLVQQAGLMCADPAFQRFLIDYVMVRPEAEDLEKAAAVAVRLICGVKSRSEIVLGTPAAAAWDELMGKYEFWKRAA